MMTKTEPIRPPPLPGIPWVPDSDSSIAWEPVLHKTRQKSMSKNDPAERTVRDIRRKTRKQYTAEEKIRIVVSGLRGEESIAALCRREGIAESLYYSWSKEFLEAGKRRLSGDTARQASLGEVKVDPSRKSGGALHRLHCFCLEFDGACEVQRRVSTDWIIEPIDVPGYGSFSLAS